MLFASLICKNISVFAFLCGREKFSAQLKGLFFRNKCKMPRKIVAQATFVLKIKNEISAELKVVFKFHIFIIINLLDFV